MVRSRLLLAMFAPLLIALAGVSVASLAPLPTVRAAVPAVALAGRVTDAAHVLDPVQAAAITDRLARLEQDTGHQVVVATVPSLMGQDVAVFTRRLGNAWGIGRAGINDGVILLIAPRERQVRIAVGRGLEQVLTDERCARILAQDVVPRFSEGDMPRGITAGVAALDRALRRGQDCAGPASGTAAAAPPTPGGGAPC